MQITDLNFGIKKWYLRPPVIVKIATALMTLILLIYMFVMGGKFSDVLWKSLFGKSHIIFVLFMAATMIAVALTFLFYFYKIFPERAMVCFFASIGCAAVFVLEYFVFCVGYISQSKCDDYAKEILNHVGNVTDAATEWFMKEYQVSKESETLGDVVTKYARSRTVDVKGTLSGIAMVWIVLYVVLIFVVLFESKTESGNSQSVRDLTPGVET